MVINHQWSMVKHQMADGYVLMVNLPLPDWGSLLASGAAMPSGIASKPALPQRARPAERARLRHRTACVASADDSACSRRGLCSYKYENNYILLPVSLLRVVFELQAVVNVTWHCRRALLAAPLLSAALSGKFSLQLQTFIFISLLLFLRPG